MYLGNFPEDYEIKADRLYHLWEAEGFVTISADDDGDEIQGVSVDNIAELYLNELVKRCLVQVSKYSVDGWMQIRWGYLSREWATPQS